MGQNKDLEQTIIFMNRIKKCNAHDRYRFSLLNDAFSKISQVYPFTNELMKQYNDLIDFNDKKILTVTGSGDQVISAMMRGASEIDTFDCNKLTYYHLFLKLAAIKALSYEEFLDFYTFGKEEKPQKKKKEHYKKIRDFLVKSDIVNYWDNFFKLSNDYFSYFFLGVCGAPKAKSHAVEYINDEAFNNAKDKIHFNVLFKNIDVNLLPYVYDKEFDFINLSNIFNYVNDIQFFGFMIDKLLNKNVTDEGSILAGYVWDESNKEMPLFKVLEKYCCNPEILELESIHRPMRFFVDKDKFSISSDTNIVEKNSIVLCKKKN